MKYWIFFLLLPLHLFAATPRVTVLAGFQGDAEVLEVFLKDFERQTLFAQSELILFLESVSPETLKILQRHPHKNIKVLPIAKFDGYPALWNRGIEKACGEFITLYKIEDRLSPESLETLVTLLDEDPELDIVCASPLPEDNPAPRPLYRKQLHEKIGLYDECFYYCGETEFWNRAYKQGAHFQKDPKFLTHHFHTQLTARQQDRVFFEYHEVARLYKKQWIEVFTAILQLPQSPAA